MCVVSAVVAGLVILAAIIAELVFYYTHSEWLMLWSSMAVRSVNDTSPLLESMPSQAFNETFAVNLTTISRSTSNVTESMFDDTLQLNGMDDGDVNGDIIYPQATLFLTFISMLGILVAISVGLLLHLLSFHVYISCLGMTTYEYIRSQRQHSNIPSTQAPATAAALKTLHKSSATTQMYFCSAVEPLDAYAQPDDAVRPQKTLNCCTKAILSDAMTHTVFYMCSTSMSNTAGHSPTRTYYCCSEFRRAVGTPRETTNHARHGDNNDGHPRVQYYERCTFCSFDVKPSTRAAATEAATPAGGRHCCAHNATNHQRNGEWKCCARRVGPGDTLHTVSAAIADASQNRHTNGGKNTEYALKPEFNAKHDSPRMIRSWPIARVRHMWRMIPSCRQPIDDQHGGQSAATVTAAATTVKSNQVQPIAMPPKNVTSVGLHSVTAIRSAAGSNGDTIRIGLASVAHKDAVDGSVLASVTVPALPPPTRRKLRNDIELDKLAESLSFVQQQQLRHNIAMANSRRRRKNLLRGRSPTLSPIHETGYSNTASPQPCRHGGMAPPKLFTKHKIKYNNTSTDILIN